MKVSPAAARAGFTLAELAVTIVIVGIGLTLILQGINTSMATASQTHNLKVARELASQTLGDIASGLYWEEIDERLYGTYSEEGYPDFTWEVAIGDEALTDFAPDDDPNLAFDSLRYDDYGYDDEDEDEEESSQPFEKVLIRVTYPKIGEFENLYLLEQWLPWEQVYGSEEDEEGSESSGSPESALGGASR